MESGDTLQLDFGSTREVLTVAKLNRKARLLVEKLGKIWVEGEISNLSQPSSGHMYWSLKDAQAQVRCAMFRQAGRRVSCKLENGLQVMVEARVSVYEARGDYQLIVDRVEEAGVGLLQRRFEELKRKLAAEGLFDAERKKPLPTLPERIGIITSPTGAALRDVLIALRRRFPATQVLIYPTSVQGEGAPPEICRALALADRRAECDLLILTRGGGSLEDLWAFNDERVARAVAALKLPIIVGVGHEIDFTIADFVADMRAPTPSQAAELAVPDCGDFLARLSAQHARLARAAGQHIGVAQHAFAALAHRLQRAHPGVAVRSQHQRLDELEARLKRGLERAVARRRTQLGDIAMRISAANPRHKLSLARNRWHTCHERLRKSMHNRLERLSRRTEVAARALQSLSPLATLERGYAIVSTLEDAAAPRNGGRVVTHSSQTPPGSRIAVRLARGRLTAGVERSEPPEE